MGSLLSIDVDQLQQESDRWKKKLELLLLENAVLKNRLAEVVNASHATVPFLETAEEYQNRFMQKDDIINLMRQDITEFDKLLAQSLHHNKDMMRAIVQRQRRLRKELSLLESTFKNLKGQFNQLL
ncbi:hypothetical protein SAMN05421788_10860 [Filimonas lacunae]|uniref:FlgN protein n=1 Tax=Filimonas lacunae TaxID=477680 RepID=A0A173MED5_9BACT|nr:hypothetical protein [Filimonas lacunae]BAV05798.1 hypothetical protein FLA_1810 [Filimonas lacunae]SIT28587.1 hypothetical protein SAMN05421788_10860 [Filimonas lacunae]